VAHTRTRKDVILLIQLTAFIWACNSEWALLRDIVDAVQYLHENEVTVALVGDMGLVRAVSRSCKAYTGVWILCFGILK
jgi:hypothetical protein